jgi:hypothetical protein
MLAYIASLIWAIMTRKIGIIYLNEISFQSNSQKLCCDCQEKEPGNKYSFERTLRKIGGIPKESRK